MVKVAALKPGDRFTYWCLDKPHAIEVLRAPETGKDLHGRSVLKVWCRTADREGWITYGPNAEIELDD